MQSYTLDHVRDDVLRRDLAASTVRVHGAMAIHLAYIAEFDARRLYAPAGFSCMHAYCVRELRLTHDSASKRIQAARAARRFPALFPALAEGRINVSAVCELAPHLTDENATELMELATHRSKFEIRGLLGNRLGFVKRTEFVQALPERKVTPEASLNFLHAPAHVRTSTSVRTESVPTDSAPTESVPKVSVTAYSVPEGSVSTEAAAVDGPDQRQAKPARDVESSSTKRFLVQFTMSEDAHAKLRYAQALLSHAVPNGELAGVFERALDALIPTLETRKFGALRRERIAARPSERIDARAVRPVGRTASSAQERRIPRHIKRAVWKRDKGRCTFVSASGTRCAASRLLEFDHIQPVALGGTATVDGLRLRCRAHNQLEAERIFGAGFMARKRAKAERRT